MSFNNFRFKYALTVFAMLIQFNVHADDIPAISNPVSVNDIHQYEKLSLSSLKENAGKVLFMYAHPKRPEKVWIGTSHGGLWQSDDEGHSWMLASDKTLHLSVSSIASEPLNPNVIYVGTGNGLSNEMRHRGQGILKSEDGGASWNFLSLTSPEKVGENWSHINSIAVNSVGVVLAATSDNKRNGFVYRSIDAGRSWGLFPVYVGSKVGPHNIVHKIKFDPDNSNAAIFMDDYANVTHSVDGGVTWNVVRKSSTSCK